MSLSTQEQKTLDLLLKKKYGGKNKKYSADPNQGKHEKSDKLKKQVQSLTNEINGLKFQLKNIPISGPQIPPRPPRLSNPSKPTVPSNSLKMRNTGDDKISKGKKVKFKLRNDEHTIFRCPEITGTNHSQKVKNYVHLCRSFTYGGGGPYTCKFGNRCHFYHPDPRNMCPQGANCLYKDCRNFHPHQWYVPK